MRKQARRYEPYGTTPYEMRRGSETNSQARAKTTGNTLLTEPSWNEVAAGGWPEGGTVGGQAGGPAGRGKRVGRGSGGAEVRFEGRMRNEGKTLGNAASETRTMRKERKGVASSHRLPRSGPEWRKGVGKAGGGRMAELDEGGFSDVDSPSTTNPPASSPTLDAARGMKDE
ncbi:hypothetical protein ALC56_12228 [Trachymyrmex septentrionalis]|uniref:Uncharacterized protein n=1 Tax=Trachymyrmex septentrionalis TaxID=34720 RepID=A0A195EZF9_9HYME|nr:hypothetical protein ALC56_12228 [Trachymyrmex septentrionalis]